jgi:predicted DNA-binding antitoxin AbrB/MazE fold protein
MKAYRTYLTIEDPKQVVLPDVPFRSGQQVEIVVRAADENNAERVNELKALLKATQALPQVQALSEDDIRREVEAYRSGQ